MSKDEWMACFNEQLELEYNLLKPPMPFEEWVEKEWVDDITKAINEVYGDGC